jgi:serine/threonine-protein kinase
LIDALLDGRYQVVREIAVGGMSAVYEAIHVKIGRPVAIKVLHRNLASDPDVVARFINEARAVGTFGHPNIVASTDFGELPGGVPYLVLEYLNGRTLAHEISLEGRLDLRRVVRIALQVASALDAAHARGVVHRDLTSENVFLTTHDGTADHVKVLDFGISKFLSTTDPSPKTRRGLTMGTPEFMAPEQISDPQSVDSRVDIYALGVIMYHMLAGQTPFGRLPLQSLLTTIVVEAAPPIDRYDLPDGLRSIVERALVKNPAERYATMRELGLELERFSSLMMAAETLSGRLSTMPPAPTVVVSRAWSQPVAVSGTLGGQPTPPPAAPVAVKPGSGRTWVGGFAGGAGGPGTTAPTGLGSGATDMPGRAGPTGRGEMTGREDMTDRSPSPGGTIPLTVPPGPLGVRRRGWTWLWMSVALGGAAIVGLVAGVTLFRGAGPGARGARGGIGLAELWPASLGALSRVVPDSAPSATPSAAGGPTLAVELPGTASPEPHTVSLRVRSGTSGARVTLRGRTHEVPFDDQLRPGTEPELVELTAPGREGRRFWLKLDQPVHLAANLPGGRGVLEASAEETGVALGDRVWGFFSGSGPGADIGDPRRGAASRRVSRAHALMAYGRGAATGDGDEGRSALAGDLLPNTRSVSGASPVGVRVGAAAGVAAVEEPRSLPSSSSSPSSARPAAVGGGAPKPAVAPGALAADLTSPSPSPSPSAPSARPQAISTSTAGVSTVKPHGGSEPGTTRAQATAGPAPTVPRGAGPGGTSPSSGNIQAVVRSRLFEVRRCYERGKMDEPELKGRVTVRIVVPPSGGVASALVESSSLGNSRVEGCIVDAVRAWPFPAPAGSSPLVISYPFNLR